MCMCMYIYVYIYIYIYVFIIIYLLLNTLTFEIWMLSYKISTDQLKPLF